MLFLVSAPNSWALFLSERFVHCARFYCGTGLRSTKSVSAVLNIAHLCLGYVD